MWHWYFMLSLRLVVVLACKCKYVAGTSDGTRHTATFDGRLLVLSTPTKKPSPVLVATGCWPNIQAHCWNSLFDITPGSGHTRHGMCQYCVTWYISIVECVYVQGFLKLQFRVENFDCPLDTGGSTRFCLTKLFLSLITLNVNCYGTHL